MSWRFLGSYIRSASGWMIWRGWGESGMTFNQPPYRVTLRSLRGDVWTTRTLGGILINGSIFGVTVASICHADTDEPMEERGSSPVEEPRGARLMKAQSAYHVYHLLDLVLCAGQNHGQPLLPNDPIGILLHRPRDQLTGWALIRLNSKPSQHCKILL